MLHINGADITQKAYSASYRMDDALNKPLTIPFRTKHGKVLTVTPNEVPVLVPQEDSKARRTSREERGAILLGEGRPEMIRIGVLYREAHDLLGKTGHEKLQALCLIKSQPASKKRK